MTNELKFWGILVLGEKGKPDYAHMVEANTSEEAARKILSDFPDLNLKNIQRALLGPYVNEDRGRIAILQHHGRKQGRK